MYYVSENKRIFYYPSSVICILLIRTLSHVHPMCSVVTSTSRIDIQRIEGESDSAPGDWKSSEFLARAKATMFPFTTGPVSFGENIRPAM